MAGKTRKEEDRRDFRYSKRGGTKYLDGVSLPDVPFLPPPLGFIFSPEEYRKELWLEEHSTAHRKFVAQLTPPLDDEVKEIEEKYTALMIQDPEAVEKLTRLMLTEQRKAYEKAGAKIRPKLKKYDEVQHKFEIWMEGRLPDFTMNGVTNEANFATILQSEIFATGNEKEIAVVAWVICNRMRRNKQLFVESLFDDGKIPFNRSQKATSKAKDWVWKEFTSGMTPDLTQGATHYYSPAKMFKEDDEPDKKFASGTWTEAQKKKYRRAFENQDTDGGLTETPGVAGKHYCPSWSVSRDFTEIDIAGVRKSVLRVFRKKGTGPVL